MDSDLRNFDTERLPADETFCRGFYPLHTHYIFYIPSSMYISIFTGEKFDYVIDDAGSYKLIMRLHIRRITAADFGSYKCLAKNSLGETDGSIKLYSKNMFLPLLFLSLSLTHV